MVGLRFIEWRYQQNLYLWLVNRLPVVNCTGNVLIGRRTCACVLREHNLVKVALCNRTLVLKKKVVWNRYILVVGLRC
jgi:hypothetical protein